MDKSVNILFVVHLNYIDNEYYKQWMIHEYNTIAIILPRDEKLKENGRY